jgi:hypothetical protein
MRSPYSKQKVKARAVVLGARESKWLRIPTGTYGGGGSRSKRTSYRVRVVPADGRPFESTLSAWGAFADWGDMIAGYSVHVLYDPQAPQQCDLDSEWFGEVKRNWPENASPDPDWVRERSEHQLVKIEVTVAIVDQLHTTGALTDNESAVTRRQMVDSV